MLRKSLGLLPVLALALVPCRAATVFTDSTFTLSNYTQTLYTNNTATAGATYSVTQNTGFGNPAPSLQFDVSWTVDTTFTIFDGLINSNFTYNPSTAAISTIDFSLDRYVTFTSGTVILSNALANALLEQGGNFYSDSITGPAFSEGTWQTVSAAGLTASSFCLYSFTTNTLDCTQHPDFSTAGGVISFGFRTGLGHSNALGTGTYDNYSDNLSFTVTAVPEPSAYGLVAAGLAGLWFLRRRRARS
jgi:hypothetical protein